MVMRWCGPILVVPSHLVLWNWILILSHLSGSDFGAIVGGVIGGVGGLAIVIVTIVITGIIVHKCNGGAYSVR